MGNQKYTASELMAIMTAKEFRDWEVAFVGIGIPLVAGITAKRFHAPNLNIVYESGCIGPQKYRVDFNVGDSSAADGALCLTSEWRVFSDMQCGYYDVGVLGAAQVDKYGNLNTTAIFGDQDYYSPRVRLPGSGGGNDIGSNIGRVVVMLRLEPLRFVEKVDYLTTPGFLDGSPDARKKAGLLGSGPAAVVTDKGLFRFDPQTHEMYLDTVYPGVEVRDIESLVGWKLKVSPGLKTAAEPTAEELAAVRSADPANLIMGGLDARQGLSGLDEYIAITIKYSGKQ